MTSPLQIYFIRHGETAWSVSGQHTGRTDLLLTAAGETMARALAPALKNIAFKHVFTSPRLRARSTCELSGVLPLSPHPSSNLSTHLGHHLSTSDKTTAEIEPDLAEWDYGDYEGLRSVDIQQHWPHWNVWEDGCPHGETPSDVGLRADRLITRLLGLDGPIALFSHGQFGRVLAARWIDLAIVEGQHFSIDPASISILSFEHDHPERRVISLWNARYP